MSAIPVGRNSSMAARLISSGTIASKTNMPSATKRAMSAVVSRFERSSATGGTLLTEPRLSRWPRRGSSRADDRLGQQLGARRGQVQIQIGLDQLDLHEAPSPLELR